MTLDPFTTAPDVYESVLGIPPGQRPPNHYELIGAQLFEPDIKAIARTADAQIARLRKLRPDAQTMQKLYYELNLARAVLTNPATKAGYDQQLRTTPPDPVAGNGFNPEPFALDDQPFGPVVKPKRKRGPGAIIAAVGVNAAIFFGALIYFGSRPAETTKISPAPIDAAAPPVVQRTAPRPARTRQPATPMQPATPPAAQLASTERQSGLVASRFETMMVPKPATLDNAATQTPSLLPMPSNERQGPLLKRLAEVYGDEFSAARKSKSRSKLLAALAEKALQQGEKEKDPDWKYVIFAFAQMVAIESRDLPLSVKVLDAVCGQFNVDEIGQRWVVLEAVCGKTRDPASADILREFAQQSIAYQRYDVAFQAMKLAKGSQPERMSPFDRIEFESLNKFVAAVEKLQSGTLDPNALHDAGIFYVFIAGKRAEGFELLAGQSIDAALGNLAAMELAATSIGRLHTSGSMAETIGPMMNENYLRLARGWREYGQQAREKSFYRVESFDRARQWYLAASLKGADRIEAEEFSNEWDKGRPQLVEQLHAMPQTADNSEQAKKAKELLTARAKERARIRQGETPDSQSTAGGAQANGKQTTGSGPQKDSTSGATAQPGTSARKENVPTISQGTQATMTPQQLVTERAIRRGDERPMVLHWEHMQQPVFIHPMAHMIMDPFGGHASGIGHPGHTTARPSHPSHASH